MGALTRTATRLVSAFVGLEIIRRVAQSFFQTNLAMDSIRRSLEAVGGSSAVVSREMRFIEEVSGITGVALQKLSQQWVGVFAAANQVPGRLEAARKGFEAIVETAARMGKSTESVGLALYGFQQLVGGVTVQLDELQKQIGDQLPGVMPALARELGITGDQLRKMATEGKLLVDDVLGPLERAIRSLARGDGAIETMRAALGRLSTEWTRLMEALGNIGIFYVLGKAIDVATFSLSGFRRGIEGATEAFKSLLGIQAKAGSAEALTQQLEAIRKQQDLLSKQELPTGRRTPADERQANQILLERNRLNDEAIRLQKELEAILNPPKTGPSKDEIEREKQLKRLAGFKETNAAILKDLEEVNTQLDAIRSKDVGKLLALGLDPLSPAFEQERKGAEGRLLKQQKDLQDKLLNIEKEGRQGRATAASQYARGQEEQLEAALNRQLNITKAGFDQQRQQLDQELGARLQREPNAYAAIADEVKQRRQAIALAEAKEIERITVEGETKRLAATEARLNAERAQRPVDAAAIEADRVKAAADAEARIQAARTRTAEVERGLSQKSLDDALKDAQAAAQARSRVIEAELEGRQQVIAAEKGLIQAQVEGRVLTEAEGLARIKALQQEEFDNALQLIDERTTAEKRAIQDRLGQTEEAQALMLEIEKRAAADAQALKIEQQEEQQELLNNQLAEYERFAERVENFLNDVVTQFLTGTLNALEFFKTLLIRTLANIVSSVIAPFITAISSSVVGGLGQAIGGAFGASLVGAVGGGGIDLLGTAGNVAGGAGLLNQLGILGPMKSAFGFLSNAFTTFTGWLDEGAIALSNLFGVNGVTQELFDSMKGLSAQVGLTPVSGLTALGGLAGIGGGIFAALTAENLGGQIGGALGAVAGGTALLSGLGVLAPIFGPIGLALSALLPILGGILGGLGAPKGPRLAIGGLGGLGLRVGETGGLTLTGDLTSQLRAERTSGEQEIQATLEANLTNMIRGLVDVINQVAIEPGALLQPAQEALDTALRQALVLNSSSRENMARDIEDQLRTVVVQVGTFFLAPMLDAFRQLEDADLETQIQRLPVAVGQLATVFRELNNAFTEAQNAENADVTRVFGEIQDRLNTFRQRLVEQTTAIAGEIVDGVIQASQQTLQQVLGRSLLVQQLSIPGLFTQPLQAAGSLQGAAEQLGAAGLDFSPIQAQLERLFTTVINDAFTLIGNALTRGPFIEALGVILSIPQEIAALNPALQQIRLLAQAFATVVGPLNQSIAELEAQLTPLDERLMQTADTIGELRQSIVEAGDDIAVALPLYDALRQAILRELELKTQQIQAQQQIIQENEQLVAQAEDLISSLEAQVRGSLSPARQAEALRAELAALQAQPQTLETLTQQQALLQELAQLGESSNSLALIAEAQAGLQSLIPLAEQQALQAQQAITVAEAQLIAMTGTADATDALRIVQEQALGQLQQLNAQLEQLFVSSAAIQQSLALPVPVVITGQAAQHGGVIGFAGGGMVPAMLEPGEAVLSGMNGRQLQAAQTWNSAFPRFNTGGWLVPGSGSGDTVPAMLPIGSFVMNRRAVGAMRGSQGYQAGGVVQGGAAPVNVNITINLPNATMRDDRDIKKLADELARHTQRILKARLP